MSYRLLSFIFLGTMFFVLGAPTASANGPRRVAAENVVIVDDPFACRWNNRRGRYNLVRVRRFLINKQGESVAVTRNITRQVIRARRQRSRLISRRIQAVEQRLESRPHASRLIARLERLKNRRENVLRIPNLAQKCGRLVGPPGETSACLKDSFKTSFTFVPGAKRTAALQSSSNCEGSVYYEFQSTPAGFELLSSGSSISVYSTESLATNASIRQCIEFPDASWTCASAKNISLTPCSLTSKPQAAEVLDGFLQELELYVDPSCDSGSYISILVQPQKGQITETSQNSVLLNPGYSLGADSFSYRVCNASHGTCGSASTVNLQIVQGADFLGNAESLAPYREYISAAERRHLVWKLGLNAVELLDDEGGYIPLSDFIATRLLNPDWVSPSALSEIESLQSSVFEFPVASEQDPFIIDMPDLSSSELLTAGTRIPLFSQDIEQAFRSNSDIAQGIDRFLSVSARGYHNGSNKYFWGHPQAGGYAMYRARYLQPAATTMLHFFMGHFGTAGSTITGAEQHWVGDYYLLLNRYTLGNFRELIRGTSSSGCATRFETGSYGLGQGMLCNTLSNFWLDNHTNTKTTPNENFSREFMELYVLGTKDPITEMKNYSDVDDVASATRFMSGISPNFSVPSFKRLYTFDPSEHSQEQRSIFQDAKDFYPALALEDVSFTPAEYTDHLFDHHPSAARFIARKIFSMLVYPDPPAAIVEELAVYFEAENFDLHKLLVKIAGSEAMFSDKAAERACISSPFQSFSRTINGLRLSLTSLKESIGGVCGNDARRCQQKFMDSIQTGLSQAGEALLDFPDVFAYDYCGEDEGKDGSGAWLTSANLLSRTTSMISFIADHSRYIEERQQAGVITRFHQLRNLMTGTGSQGEILPEDVIAYFQNTFSLKLDQQEYDLLKEYLTHDWASGNPQRVSWDPTNTSFMEKKLAGLTAIVAGMAQVNIH